MTSPTKKKPSGFAWLLWWKVDEDDVEMQAENYSELGIFKSARGVAVLFMAFSIVVNTVAVAIGWADIYIYVDSALFAILGTFIYLGHRWAAIAAMLLWTLEKGDILIEGFNDHKGSPVIQIIWWCIYMHAFYFAFRVEQERRQADARRPDGRPK